MVVLHINDAYCCSGKYWFSEKFDTISLRTQNSSKNIINNVGNPLVANKCVFNPFKIFIRFLLRIFLSLLSPVKQTVVKSGQSKSY